MAHCSSRFFRKTFLVLAGLCLVSWHQSIGAEQETSPTETIESIGVRNARMPEPHLLTGGQITPEQMKALREAGFHRFISLRPSDESGADWEEAFAGKEKIDFVRIPVAGISGLNRENAARLAEELARPGAEGTVVYCGSGNRVGGLLALKAHWLDGKPAAEALELGKKAGLTQAEPEVRKILGLEEDQP